MSMPSIANNTLVSIIVPLYNCERWLEKCIASIAQQTYQNIEIILINDGSSDNSESVCNKWQQKDPRIKYFYQKNSGVSTARNRGIAEAQGCFLCFVDGDDWIEDNHIALLYDGIMDNHTDMATVGYKKVTTYTGHCQYSLPISENTIDLNNEEGEKQLIELFKSRLLFSPCTHLFRADIIKKQGIKFHPDVCFGEDRLFILDYLSHCSRFKPVRIASYNYRVENPNSLSTISNDDTLSYEITFYHANASFFRKVRFCSSDTKEWLCTPLFNAYMDSLIMYSGNNYISYLKKAKEITSDRLFNTVSLYSDKSTYSKYWLFLIKYSLCHLIALLLFINQKRKNEG